MTDALDALRARRHSLACLVCAREPSDGVTLFQQPAIGDAPAGPWLCEDHAPRTTTLQLETATA